MKPYVDAFFQIITVEEVRSNASLNAYTYETDLYEWIEIDFENGKRTTLVMLTYYNRKYEGIYRDRRIL